MILTLHTPYTRLADWLTMGTEWEEKAKTTRAQCCAQSFSRVQLCVTPWAGAHQASFSMRILQARILERVAMSSSKGSSQPRERTQVSCTVGRFFTIWAIREVQLLGKDLCKCVVDGVIHECNSLRRGLLWEMWRGYELGLKIFQVWSVFEISNLRCPEDRWICGLELRGEIWDSLPYR